MSAPVPAWVVSALLDDDLLALNRAIGIIRRRNIQAPRISLGRSARAGVTRLVCTVEGDAAATERMANQLRKMVGVHEVLVHPGFEVAAREHALVRVRVSPAQLSALLDTVAVYDAAVIDESPHDLVIEATGTAPCMGALLRALEPFGILDLVRGGTLALPPAPDAAPPRVATAIPA